MAENSKIEWTDHTFNPWIGCMKVGPGCDHCYAETLATARLGVEWGAGAPRRRTAASTWKQPTAWNRRAEREGARYRVFCSSLADVFDNEVDPAWRADLFELIRITPHLDWLLLTKRIGNVAKMADAAAGLPANVWLGATIVNQAEADRDIPKLLATPAAKRFLSMEPLLGAVDLHPKWLPCGKCRGRGWYLARFADNHGTPCDECVAGARAAGIAVGQGQIARSGPRIDWVIVGGESGPGARPMHPDWARSLRDQCAAARVPFLFKQWGEWLHDSQCGWINPSIDIDAVRSALIAGEGYYRLGKKLAGRMLDGVQHDGVPL